MLKKIRFSLSIFTYFILLIFSIKTSNIWAEENSISMSDPDTFELTGMLWGANEIGAKDCSSSGESLPKSMDGWFKAVSEYSQSEKARDNKLNADIAALKKKIDEIIAKTTTKELQTEALQFQIDSVNEIIASINGANGRIPLREKLLSTIQKSLEYTNNENKKTYLAYKIDLIQNGFEEAIKIAQMACDRKKIIETCEKFDDKENCIKSKVNSPVPGCDVAQKTIQMIHSGPAQAYGDIYLVKKIASKELNEKMAKFEIVMTEMNNGILKSNDSQFDWTTPISKGLTKMIAARNEAGVICPYADDKNKEGKKNEDIPKKAKIFLEILGVSAEDLDKAVSNFTTAWNETDQVIGQAGQRPSYFEKVKKLLEGLIVKDKVKLGDLQTQLEALKNNLKKVKAELGISSINEEICPASPLPNGVRVCDSHYNVWCDPTTTEGKSFDAYISCMRRAEANIAIKSADSSVSNYIKNHPDFVGLVQNSPGGRWDAKMKKPDGTIYFVDKSFDGIPVTAESCGPYPLPMGSFCMLGDLDYSHSSAFCNPTTPQGKAFAIWTKCNNLVVATDAIQCIPEYRGSIVFKACPAAGSSSPSIDASKLIQKDPCKPDYPGGPVLGPCPAFSGGVASNSTSSESEGGNIFSAEPSASSGYAKAFSPTELEIYGKVPNKTNFTFTQSKSAPTSISFFSKGKSIEVCKSELGTTKCSKDSDGPSMGRTAFGLPVENKAKDFIHRMSFTFKADNYFTSNPGGHFAFGLRGELRNTKQDSKEAGADGRGVIFGNIAGDKRNAGFAKCGNGIVEAESYSRDAFAKGLSPRANEIFPETCSGSIFQDNKYYKVEIDVTRNTYILYRLYDSSGKLLQKNYVKDQPSTRIDPGLVGWFIGHVFDVTTDQKDNDGDGIVDNESSNWSFLIDNFRISSGALKP
ncbi:MAG: hypothetical protein H7281_16655 [Bacteriovorax sp.]|nr:hypothetical protein [Bacteriovorax sp.]